MPDWNLVGKQHVLAAIAEHDRLGSREFLARYRFRRAHASSLWHQGQEYDPRAIVGVAYLHASGRSTPEEPSEGEPGAVRVLTDLGFDVVVDEEAMAAEQRKAVRRPAATRTAAGSSPRASKPKSTAKSAPKARRTTAEPEAKICPTCYMALPATGICDNCD